MVKVMAETKMITQMGTGSTAYPRNLRTMELIQSGALGEILEVHVVTDRPIWPQGYDSLSIEDPVPSTLAWDTWLGPAPYRPFVAKWPEGHAVYSPEKKHQFNAEGAVYHRHNWRGWTEFGSGAIGDIAPHSMNVIFMALDLGPPSAVEVVRASGMKKEMYPEWTVMRYSCPQRGIHPPLSIYWYDGGQQPPESIAKQPSQPPGAAAAPLRQGAGPLTWIGTKGSLPQGLGPFQGQQVVPYETPAPKDWGREDVYKDWVAGVRNGKQPSCNFGFSGPFTESYQLGNIALRVGHRIEWDALAFRITNCREANQYLRRQQYRRGYDLKEIAGSAFNV
jgi:predicted dehydrogenase